MRSARQHTSVGGAAHLLTVAMFSAALMCGCSSSSRPRAGVGKAVAARRTSERRVGVHGDSASTLAEARATAAELAGLIVVTPGGGTGALTGEAPTMLAVLDPSSGRTIEIRFPISGVKSIDYPFVSLGSRVVILVNTQTGPYDPTIGTAYLATSSLQQSSPIGPASDVLAAVDPDRIWLVADNATPDQRLHFVEYGTIRTVTEVSLTGGDRSPPYPLTARRTPIAAVSGGLLTIRPDRLLSNGPGNPPGHTWAYEIWDPATDRVVRRLDIDSYTGVASSRYVAWTARTCDSDHCPLHITDLGTGADRLVAPPAGKQWSQDWVFSADSAKLAVVAVATTAQGENQFGLVPRTMPALVAVIDTATGTVITRSTTMQATSALIWSPDGTLLFFAHDNQHLGYFNATYTTSPIRELKVTDARSSLILAKPPHPATSRETSATTRTSAHT